MKDGLRFMCFVRGIVAMLTSGTSVTLHANKMPGHIVPESVIRVQLGTVDAADIRSSMACYLSTTRVTCARNHKHFH